MRECVATNKRILDADHRLIIVGGGPAGLSAAVYAARAEMKPLVRRRVTRVCLVNFGGFVIVLMRIHVAPCPSLHVDSAEDFLALKIRHHWLVYRHLF